MEPAVTDIDRASLGHEWEWENSPEVTLVVTDDVDEATRLCNAHSPHFVVSMVTADADELERFYRATITDPDPSR